MSCRFGGCALPKGSASYPGWDGSRAQRAHLSRVNLHMSVLWPTNCPLESTNNSFLFHSASVVYAFVLTLDDADGDGGAAPAGPASLVARSRRQRRSSQQALTISDDALPIPQEPTGRRGRPIEVVERQPAVAAAAHPGNSHEEEEEESELALFSSGIHRNFIEDSPFVWTFLELVSSLIQLFFHGF